MKYGTLIESIVEELLDEVTFLQAYKMGTLKKDQIHTATKMRNTASQIMGKKIPVLSADTGFGSERPVPGHHGVIHQDPEEWQAVSDEPYQDWDAGAGSTNSQKLRQKYTDEKIDHVVANVEPGTNKKEIVPAIGHELGHMVDLEQGKLANRYKAAKGSQIRNAKVDKINQDALKGVSTKVKAGPEEKALIKSEGRAWRYGKALQDMASPPTRESDANWTRTAQYYLRDYAGPYVRRK